MKDQEANSEIFKVITRLSNGENFCVVQRTNKRSSFLWPVSGRKISTWRSTWKRMLSAVVWDSPTCK